MSHQQVKDDTSQPSGTSEKRPVDAPPYIPECEVFEEGDPEAGDKLKNCTRQCQNGFIHVRDFTKDQMPEGCQSEKRWKEFEKLCVRTVKLKVSYTSLHRPLTHPDSTAPYPYIKYRGLDTVNRTGTGFIIGFDNRKQPWVQNERCPCPECKDQGSEQAKNGYFKVIVVTAAHVVFDDGEAEKTVCEVFDDDPDNSDKVRYLHGVKGVDRESVQESANCRLYVRSMCDKQDMDNIEKRPRHDVFIMECVSHDWMFYKEFESVLGGVDLTDINIPVIVSHPHGASKMVSVGRTYPALRVQLPKTRTPDTPFNMPVRTNVWTEIDLETRYPGFFGKSPYMDTWYVTTQPLHVYIPCDESNTVTFRWKERFIGRFYLLPEGSRLTSVDGGTDIPCDSFGFDVKDLLSILNPKDRSHRYVYDTHTCNGSSGAWVMTGNGYVLNYWSCHFGKMEGGLNTTGMYKYWWW